MRHIITAGSPMYLSVRILVDVHMYVCMFFGGGGSSSAVEFVL